MQFGRSRCPVPFPCPPSLLCHYAALLLPSSFRNLWLPFGIYCMSNYLLATGLVSVPVPLPPSPLPLPATVLIFDMTNVRRLIRPQTTRSSPKEANLLRCAALHCTALWQSKPCINYTKRRLSRHATPPASHLHSAFVVLGLNWTTLCCARGKTN